MAGSVPRLRLSDHVLSVVTAFQEKSEINFLVKVFLERSGEKAKNPDNKPDWTSYSTSVIQDAVSKFLGKENNGTEEVKSSEKESRDSFLGRVRIGTI